MEITKQFLIKISGKDGCRGLSCVDCPLYIITNESGGCQALDLLSQSDLIKYRKYSIFKEISKYAKQMIETFDKIELWKKLK